MYVLDSFVPLFVSEAQDVDERFIHITRLNCGGCLLYYTSFLFVRCVRTVSGRLYPLGRELIFLMLFLPFSFSLFFPLSFWSLLFAAFLINSNVLQAQWLFLWWNQCHHLTPTSCINDKGECFTFCSPGSCYQLENTSRKMDKDQLICWPQLIFCLPQESYLHECILFFQTLLKCGLLDSAVPSVSHISTAHGSTY